MTRDTSLSSSTVSFVTQIHFRHMSPPGAGTSSRRSSAGSLGLRDWASFFISRSGEGDHEGTYRWWDGMGSRDSKKIQHSLSSDLLFVPELHLL
jgi:hypothetical protein